MGIDDKFDAKFDQATGKVKQGLGGLSGDEDLQAEGRRDAAKGDFQEGWQDAKDAAGSGWEKVKDAGREAAG